MRVMGFRLRRRMNSRRARLRLALRHVKKARRLHNRAHFHGQKARQLLRAARAK